MSPLEQRIAIAQTFGWESIPGERISDHGHLLGLFGGEPSFIPDYLSDLNYIHAAKQQLLTSFELCYAFNRNVMDESPPRSKIVHETDKWSWGQEADVQARALLKTLGLWKEDDA